jgi:hypothetical protein
VALLSCTSIESFVYEPISATNLHPIILGEFDYLSRAAPLLPDHYPA